MNSLITFHFLNPRRWRAPVQVLLLADFHAHHSFENAQYKRLIDFSAFDLIIAMRAVLQNQFKWRNGEPKTLVVHRGYPFFNLIQIFEFSHASKIPNLDVAMQKVEPKRGWIWISTYQTN